MAHTGSVNMAKSLDWSRAFCNPVANEHARIEIVSATLGEENINTQIKNASAFNCERIEAYFKGPEEIKGPLYSRRTGGHCGTQASASFCLSTCTTTGEEAGTAAASTEPDSTESAAPINQLDYVSGDENAEYVAAKDNACYPALLFVDV